MQSRWWRGGERFNLCTECERVQKRTDAERLPEEARVSQELAVIEALLDEEEAAA